MAAHICTALREFADTTIPTFRIKEVLDYGAFGGQLDFDDWQAMHEAADKNILEVNNLAAALLPKYEKRWQEIGEPNTYEAWIDAMVNKRLEE